MKRTLALALATAALLAGCATTPAPPGAIVAEGKLEQSVVPGRTTRAQLLAALGPTRSIAFDSGYEVFLYQAPASAGYREIVILVDPHGVVSKLRRRDPSPGDPR